MPVNSDTINEAIQSGYSPDQIIDHIQSKYPEYKAKFAEAIQEGYSSSEIIDHLRSKVPSAPQNAVLEAPVVQEGQSIGMQRAQMGLPLRNRVGQPINEIRPSESFLPEANKKISETQSAFSTPEPKGIKGFIPGFSIARGAEDVGQRLGADKPVGKQALGLGVDIASTAALGGPGGTISGPLTKAFNLPFKYGSKALSATIGQIPIVKSAAESLSSRLASWAAGDPLSHKILSKMFDFETENNLAYHEIDQFGKELGANNLTDASKTRIYHVIEAMRGKGKTALNSLTDSEQELVNKLLPVRNALSSLAKKEGVVDEAAETEGYLTRFYKEGKAKGFLRSPMKTAPIALKRTFGTIKDLEEAQTKITNELESKGLTAEQALNKSDAELKELGFNPKIKSTLSLKPNTDPIRSIQAQMLATRMAVNTKKIIMDLPDLRNELGENLIENSYGPGRIKLDSPIFKKWVARSLKSGNSQLVRFADKDAYVLKKYAGSVNKLINAYQDYPTWMKEFKELNRATKFVRFFNPGVHNLNETSSALQYFNGNLYRALGIPGKAISKDPNRMSEAIADGFKTQRLYELKNGIAKDLDVTFNKFKSSVPYLTDTMDTIQRRFTNPALWNHVEHIGLTVWDAAKQKLISQGMDPESAGKAAVTLSEDVIGKMTSYNAMAMFKDPKVNTLINFIPSWVNSSVRKYIGAFLPDIAFQHLPSEARKALQIEYQHNLIHGLTLGHLITQRLNFALSGHSTFENQPENRPSVSHPFGKIELSHNGRLYSLDLPIMGSLTLPPRMMAALYNIGRGRPQAALGYLQPITSAPLAAAMETYRTKSPMAGLRAAGQQMSPISAFTDPRKSMGETTLNTVLPFRLQQADPRTDAVKKLWTMYKNDNKFEIIAEQEPWKNDVDKAIQNKEYDKAGQIIRMHYTGSRPHEFFQHRMLKFTKPNTYTYLMIPQNKRSKYVQQLDSDELSRFQEAIKKEATPEGSTP